MRFVRRLFGSHADHRTVVESGRVACPRGGFADIEECFRCSAFRDFEDQPREVVVCERERTYGVPPLPA